MKQILVVAIGGAAGSILRYLGTKWIRLIAGYQFPTGTLLVNLAGCLLIGIFFSLAARHQAWNEEIRLLLMTGLCGGFTTFSAFSLDGIHLLKDNKPGLFILYVSCSVIGGLLATLAGIKLIK